MGSLDQATAAAAPRAAPRHRRPPRRPRGARQAAVPALRRTPPRLVREPALAGHTHCFTGQRACASPARARPHGSPERSSSTAATKTDHLAAAEKETPDTAVKLEPDESEDNLETK